MFWAVVRQCMLLHSAWRGMEWLVILCSAMSCNVNVVMMRNAVLCSNASNVASDDMCIILMASVRYVLKKGLCVFANDNILNLHVRIWMHANVYFMYMSWCTWYKIYPWIAVCERLYVNWIYLWYSSSGMVWPHIPSNGMMLYGIAYLWCDLLWCISMCNATSFNIPHITQDNVVLSMQCTVRGFFCKLCWVEAWFQWPQPVCQSGFVDSGLFFCFEGCSFLQLVVPVVGIVELSRLPEVYAWVDLMREPASMSLGWLNAHNVGWVVVVETDGVYLKSP